MITKQKMEEMCRNAGMHPASRDKVRGREIFIADGEISDPELFRKFGLGAGSTEKYATIWFASRGLDDLDIGRALFFDEKDNTGGKRGRVNAALKDAKESIEARDHARTHMTSALRLH